MAKETFSLKNRWFGYRARIIAATPLICLIAYLLVGFIWGVWHPTWAIFFLIPVMPFLLGTKSITQVISYPLVCVAIFLTLGFVGGWWHPGWVIFLTIPVFYTLVPKHKKPTETVIDFTDND